MINIAGIFAIFKKKRIDGVLLDEIKHNATKIKHRGRESRFIYEDFPIEVIFYQKKEFRRNVPLNFAFDKNSNNLIVIDGKIYNLKEMNAKYLSTRKDMEQTHKNNLEGIIAGYKKCGIEILNQLFGSFSGIFYDGTELIGFKDPIGGKPLYYCENQDFIIYSSELKALSSLSLKITPIKPGRAKFSSGKTKRYYNFPRFNEEITLTKKAIKLYAVELKECVKLAVADSIREEEKVSALLSGGLDSAIVTYVAKDFVEKLHVYTVGFNESKDIYYAKKFAKLYNLDHSVVKVNLSDMLECLPNVIFALETFDAALIRSSIPMFLISKKVREDQGDCILLTGEGADELFGGYSYLLNFNSKESLNNKILNLLEREHSTGLQRVDRIPYFFSIEARAPLFDKRIVELSFNIPSELKIFKKEGIGFAKKWILRKAFEDEIPPEFIWRRKQKFSNGVGSEFILRDYINTIISDSDFNYEKRITPHFSLRSKEELYYWRIFKNKFKPTLETISELGFTKIFEI